MFIFIDEAGGFVRSPARHRSISCVGALVVPEKQFSRVYREFVRLRKSWPTKDGETKGRLLDEEKIDATIHFLRRFDVIFDAVVIDINRHAEMQITAHRLTQAEKITEHVTAEFTPDAAQSAWDMRFRLEGMPNQLYVQSIAMVQLVEHVVQQSTLYYCQRRPEELANFNWVVDAKDEKGVTKFEDWWLRVVMPMLQSGSLSNPLIMLKEGDYRWFERSFRKADLPEYLEGIFPESEHGYTDVGKLLGKSFKYAPSHGELGLQLVDILSNTIRRALIGNLQQSGWRYIGRLMIRKPQTLHMFSLGAVQGGNDEDLLPVFKKIDAEARPMFRPPRSSLRR